MAPSLAHFPDLCLETIFKHVPLTDLVYNVGLVCKSWLKPRRTELNKRRRLVLLADGKCETFCDFGIHLFSNGTDLIGRVRGDDESLLNALESLEQIEFNTLSVPDGIQLIPFAGSLRNFTDITRLYLKLNCSYSNLIKVLQQIDHISQNLVELKLKNIFYLDDIENMFKIDDDATAQALGDSLFAYLNRLRSLKHLQLDMALESIRILPEQMVWLSRLTTFAVRIYNFGFEEDWIFTVLNRYAQTVTCIESYSMVHVRAIPQFDNQLETRFTAMSVYENMLATMAQRFNTIQQFCTRFNSLTKLELCSNFISMPMTMLARCLFLLSELVHLDLRLGTIPPLERVQEEIDEEWEEEEEEEDADDEEWLEEIEEGIEEGIEEEGEDVDEEQGEEGQNEEPLAEQVQPQITAVPSVRLLILSFSSHSHLDTERLFISEIFPNLQVISLKNNQLECQDCAIVHRQGRRFNETQQAELELARRIAECKRLARQPFYRCAHLHTIELVDGNNFD